MICRNRRSLVKGIVGFLIISNAIQLCSFLLRSWPPPPKPHLSRKEASSFSSRRANKPWPAVPSFRPWLPNPELAPRQSCEAYFGHGFSHVFPVLEEEKEVAAVDGSVSGSLKCYLSETLGASVCEGTQVLMNPQKISMSKGGESLELVIRRAEEDELPTYIEGAIQVISEHTSGEKVVNAEMLEKLMPRGQINHHTMRMLIQTMTTINKSEAVCTEKIAGPTLFVTRFEYANLFHTVTDWYSAYASSRVTGLKQRPRVLFLDGHCESPLDDGWEGLFSGVEYAKHFSGAVCFEHAIFSPLGYNTALFKGLETGLPCRCCSTVESEERVDLSKTSRLREFGELFSAVFNAPNFELERSNQNDSRERHLKILFIRRENYLAHPRHSGKLEVRLSNEEELLTALKDWSTDMNKIPSEVTKFTVVNGLFAHMTLADQVKTVGEASIIIGAHGAGLTHIIFSKPETVVFEILSPLYLRPHYMYISQWLGLDYHSLISSGSSVNCSQVLEKLNAIVKDLLKPTHTTI